MNRTAGVVSSLSAYRLAPYPDEDLADAEDILSELLSYSLIPDDLRARLISCRDDIRQTLDDRGITR